MNTLLTFEAFAFGHTNNINHLILYKHILHRYGFLKVIPRPVHLLPEEPVLMVTTLPSHYQSHHTHSHHTHTHTLNSYNVYITIPSLIQCLH